MTLPKFF